MVQNAPKHEFGVRWGGPRCEKFRCDFVVRSYALTAPARPVLHQNLCSNETVQNNLKHEFRVQWGGSDAFVAKKFRRDFVQWTCALIVPAQPILHPSSDINKTVRNAPKHESEVQWGGLEAFVAKNFRRDCVARTCALMVPVQPVLHRSSCSYETVRNTPK
jgi:hypothetical protein